MEVFPSSEEDVIADQHVMLSSLNLAFVPESFAYYMLGQF
jgi:hypothetical protein